jgi:hypothetical protein
MPIAFCGEVVRLGDDGGHSVRLDNHHPVTAYPTASQAHQPPPAVGERVRVEMAFDEMKGWRFSRRPARLSAE